MTLRAGRPVTGSYPQVINKFIVFGEFGSLNLTGGRFRAGRPVTGSYPQDIHKFIVIREFGSLKVLDTGLGPRAYLRITRALGPRSYGLGPWFYSHETI